MHSDALLLRPVRKFLQDNGQLTAKKPPNNGKFMASNPAAEKCNGSTHDENDLGAWGDCIPGFMSQMCIHI
jgi:hypothetical protein